MKYIVKYNVADQELEKVLNEQPGYVIKQMFRNATSSGGVETTTVIFERIDVYVPSVWVEPEFAGHLPPRLAEDPLPGFAKNPKFSREFESVCESIEKGISRGS